MTPLEKARKAKGLTQLVLASKVGITQAHVSDLERGKDRASVSLAERLAKLLGITEEQILYPDRFSEQ